MFVFHKAFYLSFQGETPSADFPMQESYFVKNDKSTLDQQYTIDMYTQQRRRSLYKDIISFIRVNFPFNSLQNEAFNINPVYGNHFLSKNIKSNQEYVEEIIGSELKDAEPFTRIYIDAHGQAEEEQLFQYIYHPNKEKLAKVAINAVSLAEILQKSIPGYARNNLQIRLLSCESEAFAKVLMNCLHERGFKNTSVIAYKSEAITPASAQQGNQFSLRETYSSENTFIGPFKSPFKNDQSDKVAFHNYDGEVKKTDYRTFKKNYMNNPIYDHISDEEIPGLAPEKQEVILLKNTLVRSLGDYVYHYKTNLNSTFGSFGLFHRHDESGYRRVECFIDNILSKLKTSDILASNDLEDFITKLIDEIKAFAKQEGKYENFKGTLDLNKIHVHDHSAMSYILKGLDSFYEIRGEKLISEKLKEFKALLYTNQIKKESTKVDMPYFDLESHREAALKNIQLDNPAH